MFSKELSQKLNNKQLKEKLSEMLECSLEYLDTSPLGSDFSLFQLHMAWDTFIPEGQSWKEPHTGLVSLADFELINAAASFFAYLPLEELEQNQFGIRVKYVGYYEAEAIIEKQHEEAFA